MKINVIYEDNHVLVVEKPVNTDGSGNGKRNEGRHTGHKNVHASHAALRFILHGMERKLFGYICGKQGETFSL